VAKRVRDGEIKASAVVESSRGELGIRQKRIKEDTPPASDKSIPQKFIAILLFRTGASRLEMQRKPWREGLECPR